ncbi:DNA-binding protein [Roseivivax halodurans JCM 10272]|uniref:DNA-binding protein n=1 Tax=Roseivivax halodurans JCM 10272 TaxID=1449350 RepID=X7EGE3_9RHOB|nr:DNA-binding protein [Roseivivax halodurans JCM 10272]
MAPAGQSRHLALRLLPGEDLREAVEEAFSAEPETAGFVAAAIGSLSAARIRPAGRNDALMLAEPLEIVSLSGTLSPDGAHLHIAVADARGTMTGGHLLPGCAIRTTAEIVIALLTDLRFSRPQDPATGYNELVID